MWTEHAFRELNLCFRSSVPPSVGCRPEGAQRWRIPVLENCPEVVLSSVQYDDIVCKPLDDRLGEGPLSKTGQPFGFVMKGGENRTGGVEAALCQLI